MKLFHGVLSLLAVAIPCVVIAAASVLPEQSASYELEEGDQVAIENFAGDINVTEWDENVVLIEYDIVEGDAQYLMIEVDTSDGVSYEVMPEFEEMVSDFSGDGPYWPDREHVDLDWSVDFDVMIPSDGDFDISLLTISGDIVLVGGAGSAELNAVSGDIEASEFDGLIEVNVVSGDLQISDCARICCAAVVSGDMTADLRDIELDCELAAVDGDILLFFDPSSSKVIISTLSGDIDGGPHVIEIEEGIAGVSAFGGDGPRVIEISTISGDVELQ
jgi:hypothetical protein